MSTGMKTPDRNASMVAASGRMPTGVGRWGDRGQREGNGAEAVTPTTTYVTRQPRGDRRFEVIEDRADATRTVTVVATTTMVRPISEIR